MKRVINGKIYDTDTMTTIVEENCYRNGNCCGSNSIRVTKNGSYALVCTSNGQDLYRDNTMQAIEGSAVAGIINHWKLTEEEMAELIKRGLLTEA